MSNGGILGENWCVLLQVGHVQLTGAPQSVDYEPGKLASHSQPVRTGSALRDSHRFHRPEDAKTGCCDNHESCGLPSCQQLQSGQLETKPEGYLSVFCVERFGRDQKTQGNKSDGGDGVLWRDPDAQYDTPCLCMCELRLRAWQLPALLETQTSFTRMVGFKLSNTNINTRQTNTTQSETRTGFWARSYLKPETTQC